MIYIDDADPNGALEPCFPPRDVTIKRGVDAKEVYELISEIGRGKFGTVYKCKEKTTGLKLAAKFVPIPKREDRRNVEREVEIMNSLQHHLIIQLYAAYECQKMMCVVLELVEGGELFDRVIDDEFVLTEKVCTVFIRQVCEGMQFIHQNNILHLDLKPENILCITKEGNRIKIIDFGLARKYDPNKKLQILFGTPEFVAPEVVNFDSISYGTDMWSVGVICYVLLSGLSPFMGENDIQTMANVTIAKYDFEDESFHNVSPEAMDFIAKLLVKDLNARMTATDCLEHKWLQQRPKPPPPPISPKPINAPPPKLKAMPIQNTTITVEDNEKDVESKELETTKDNLKSFIERWEEHPNSPYVFELKSNTITPLSNSKGNSVDSSRVCSPSPCESIGSYPDEVNNNNAADRKETLEPEIQENRNEIISTQDDLSATTTFNRHFKDYLHSFDRRNSDTNYLLGRRPSSERMNLADEIRKLSDHLLMLAEINTKLGKQNNNNSRTSSSEKEHTQTPSTLSATNNKTKGHPTESCDENTVESTIDNNGNTTSRKSKGDKSKIKSLNSFSKSTSSTVIKNSTKDVTKESLKTTETTTTVDSLSGTSSSLGSGGKKISTLSVRLQQSIEETPKILNGKCDEKPKGSGKKPKKGTSALKTTTTTTTTAAATTTLNGVKESLLSSNEKIATDTKSSLERYAVLSAASKRAKFRVNQKSRDVPIGSPNIHQTFNLEEAANNTKDCLLHLLEKYNDSRLRGGPLSRHRSISVDWNVTDNLEYRSMSSINAFFQRHTTTGRNVKQLQAQLEAKTKNFV